jgi:hypothetical protein
LKTSRFPHPHPKGEFGTRNVEQVAFSLSINNTLKFEANEADVKRAFDIDKKARRVHAMKFRRGDLMQERYFEDAE